MPARGRSREVGVVSVAEHEEILRRLSIRDDAYVESLLTKTGANVAASSLDEKTHSLVRLGALIAIDAAPPSYMTVQSVVSLVILALVIARAVNVLT